MKNISASLTRAQISQSVENVRRGLPPVKDVTRRLGWLKAKAGDRLQVCEKCQGLKPGEHLVKLASIELVSVRRESLNELTRRLFYGIEEVKREGFSYSFPQDKWAGQFIRMFCEHMKATPETEVTRLEFKYIFTCNFGIAISGHGCPKPASWSSTFNGTHSGMYWCDQHATDLQEGLKTRGHDLVEIFSRL